MTPKKSWKFSHNLGGSKYISEKLEKLGGVMINSFKKGYILGKVNLDSFKKGHILGGVKEVLAWKFHDLGGSQFWCLVGVDIFVTWFMGGVIFAANLGGQ